MSAGYYSTGTMRWARAWKCPTHHVYWYDDDLVCRICGAKGEPEKLPDNATDVTGPDDVKRDAADAH